MSTVDGEPLIDWLYTSCKFAALSPQGVLIPSELMKELTKAVESLQVKNNDLLGQKALWDSERKSAVKTIELLQEDALTMALRLLGEDESSFSPETFEVMERWRPKALKLLGSTSGGVEKSTVDRFKEILPEQDKSFGVAIEMGNLAKYGLNWCSEKERKVTVCDYCEQASCWQGEFMCDNAKSSGTKELSIYQLEEMGLEDSRYWVVPNTIEDNES